MAEIDVDKLSAKLDAIPESDHESYLKELRAKGYTWKKKSSDGMLVPGNIDLGNRPRVANADGTVSTVRSVSVNMNGREVLLPTVSDDGRIMTVDEAAANYRTTGKHLGIFKSAADATRYAQRLHRDQGDLLAKRPSGPAEEVAGAARSLVENNPLTKLAGKLAAGIARAHHAAENPAVPPEKNVREIETLTKHAEKVGQALEQSLPEWRVVQKWDALKDLNPGSRLDAAKEAGLLSEPLTPGSGSYEGPTLPPSKMTDEFLDPLLQLPKKYLIDPLLTLHAQGAYTLGRLALHPGRQSALEDPAAVEESLDRLSDVAAVVAIAHGGVEAFRVAQEVPGGFLNAVKDLPNFYGGNTWRKFTNQTRALALLPDEEAAKYFLAMPGDLRAAAARENPQMRRVAAALQRGEMRPSWSIPVKPMETAERVTTLRAAYPEAAQTVANYPSVASALSAGDEVPEAARAQVDGVAQELAEIGLPPTPRGLHAAVEEGRINLIKVAQVDEDLQKAAMLAAGVNVDAIQSQQSLHAMAKKRPDELLIARDAEAKSREALDAAKAKVSAQIEEEAAAQARNPEESQATASSKELEPEQFPPLHSLTREEALEGAPEELPQAQADELHLSAVEAAGEAGELLDPDVLASHSSPEPAGEPTLEESLGPPAGIAQLKPEEFAKFNLPKEIHAKAVSDAMRANESVSPEAVEAYPETKQAAQEAMQGLDEKREAEGVDPDKDFLNWVRSTGINRASAEKGSYMGELEEAKGRGILRSKGGMSVSELAEAAFEKGEIKEHSENALFERLDRALRKSSRVFQMSEGEGEYPKEPEPQTALERAKQQPIDTADAKRLGVLADFKRLGVPTAKGGLSMAEAMKSAGASDPADLIDKIEAKPATPQAKLYLKYGSKTYPVASAKEAGKVWDKITVEAMRMGAGPRDMAHQPLLVDSYGKEVGYLSWNGRAWRKTADGKEVPFDDESAKSLEELRQSIGERTVSERGSGYEVTPNFYSKLQRDIEAKLPEKATVEQVSALLRDQKQEEVEWSGINDYLQGKEKVTKAEVLDFLRGNQVRIQEVIKGDGKSSNQETTARLRVRLDDIKREFERRGFDIGLDPGGMGGEIYIEHAAGDRNEVGDDELPDDLKPLAAEYSRGHGTLEEMESGGEPGETKYETYALPGGKNYRELLLTLPDQSNDLPDFGLWTREHVHEHPLWSMGRWAQEYESAFDVDLRNEGRPGSGLNFHSSHFDEPNILAHVRFNDRVDADGNKVLFIEEVQSDWHQRGRREGYSSDPSNAVQVYVDGKPYAFFDEKTRPMIAGKEVSLDDYVAKLKKKNDDVVVQRGVEPRQSRVPDAPFKKTWHEFALKRMLRYAAENGYDKIAWTTGDQQADRYDLTKHIDKIDYVRHPDGTFDVHADKYGRSVFKQTVVPVEKLADVVGKEVADKIAAGAGEGLAHGYKRLSGLDLKVGGEGMRGFYDKIIPSFLGKFGKKFGAAVGETTITVGPDEKSYRTAELSGDSAEIAKSLGGKVSVHAMSITPELKRAAIEEGFSLFQGGPSYGLTPEGRVAETQPSQTPSGESSSAPKSGSESPQKPSAPQPTVGESSGSSVTPPADEVKNEAEVAYGPGADLRDISRAIAEDVRQGISPSASGLVELFERHGMAPLKSAVVNNLKSTEEVIRFIRNRQAEVLAVTFEVDGAPLETQLHTSGNPASVRITKDLVDDLYERFAELKAQHPGKKVTFKSVHNHPGGNPQLSPEDLAMAQHLRSLFQEDFGGLIATDDVEFEISLGEGAPQRVPYSAPMEKFKTRGDEPLTGPGQAAAMAFRAAKGGDAHVAIYTDGAGTTLAVRAYSEGANVPDVVRRGITDARAAMAVVVNVTGAQDLPEYGDKFPHEVKHVFAIDKAGKVTTPGLMRPLVGEAPEPLQGDSAYAPISTWRLASEDPPYDVADFAQAVRDNDVKQGSVVTSKSAIASQGANHPRVAKGMKGQVLGVDPSTARLIVAFGGRPYLVEGSALVETNPGSGSFPSLKQTIKSGTENPPATKVVTDEMKALRDKLRAEEKGSLLGARAAARETKGKLLQQFAAKLADVRAQAKAQKLTLKEQFAEKAREKAAIQSAVTAYIQEHLPPSVRGRFLTDLRDAKTPEDALEVFSAVDYEATEAYKRVLFEDVKKVAARLQESPSVAVAMKKEARRIMALRFGKTRLKDLVDVSEHDLDRLHRDLRFLEEIGHGEVDARKSLVEAIKEDMANDIVADSVPINKVINSIPGAPWDPKSYGTWVEAKHWSGQVANWLQTMWMAKNPMDVIFSLGSKTPGYEGAVWKHFMQSVDSAFRTRDKAAMDVLEPIEALTKGFTDAQMHKIGVVAIRDQKGGLQKLANSNWADKFFVDVQAITLTPEEQAALDKWRELNPVKVFKPMAEKMAELYNVEVLPEDKYFPFQTVYDPDRENDVNVQVLDQVRYFDSNPNSPHFRKNVEKGMTIHRTGPGDQVLDTHFIRVITRSVYGAMHIAHIQEPLKMLYEVARREDVRQAMGKVKAKEVMLWLDLIARDGGVQGQDSRSTLDVIRRNYSRAAIPFRFATALVHGTKIMNAAAFFGAIPVQAAGRDLLSDNNWGDFLKANSPNYRKLVGDDPSYEPLNLGSAATTSPTEILKRWAQFGAQPLVKLNAWSSAVAWVTAYKHKLAQMGKAMDFSEPDEEALNFAERWTRRSQDSPRYYHMPPLLARGEGLQYVVPKGFAPTFARLITQFNLYPLNWWSNVEHDLWRLGIKQGEYAKSAQMAMWMIAQVALDAGIRINVGNFWTWAFSGIGLAFGLTAIPYGLRHKQKFKEKFEEEMLRKIPFYPLFAKAAYSDSLNIPAADVVRQTLKGVKDTGAENYSEAIMEFMRSFVESTGVAGLMPAMELGRIMTESRVAFPMDKELKELSKRNKHDEALKPEDRHRKAHMTSADRKRYGLLLQAHRDFEAGAHQLRAAMKAGDMKRAAAIAEQMDRHLKAAKLED